MAKWESSIFGGTCEVEGSAVRHGWWCWKAFCYAHGGCMYVGRAGWRVRME
ncbi:hypothetical protein [Bartonella harrusi]|uniref:Uncharacterized protein n=1 Tax=Bartonella harrusi TaxID=2961895 RepID=A0ABY5ERY4_9HYPH|nr:hypothetical protein [Bartonella harrusi]UTO28157.1 hypothetical protein NMK50_08255 [Bartonella harrusi]